MVPVLAFPFGGVTVGGRLAQAMIRRRVERESRKSEKRSED